MTNLEPRTEIALNNILFATDFSPASEAAFAYAVAIADRYHSKLNVAHVISIEAFDLIAADSPATMLKQAQQQARAKMDQLLEPRLLQGERYKPVIAEGMVANFLVEMIRRGHIDLAVLGTRGHRTFKKLLLGSTAEEIFRVARTPRRYQPRLGCAISCTHWNSHLIQTKPQGTQLPWLAVRRKFDFDERKTGYALIRK